MRRPKPGEVWAFTPHDCAYQPFRIRIERVDGMGIEFSDPDAAGLRAGVSASRWREMVASASVNIESTWKLTTAQSEKFAATLIDPPAPNARLRRAATRHRLKNGKV